MAVVVVLAVVRVVASVVARAVAMAVMVAVAVTIADVVMMVAVVTAIVLGCDGAGGRGSGGKMAIFSNGSFDQCKYPDPLIYTPI